ncbi:cyclin-B1-2-like [Wolffia australiana]
MEMSQSSIQNDVAGIQNDALRFGLNGVKSEIMAVHPLQPLMESTKKMHENMKRMAMANIYGSAFPLKMDLDRQIFSRFQRPPGAIPSSMLGLDVVSGAIDDFGFEDYLGDPRDSDSVRPVDMHHGMEIRLGLSKGPVHPSF